MTAAAGAFGSVLTMVMLLVDAIVQISNAFLRSQVIWSSEACANPALWAELVARGACWAGCE